MHWAFGQDFAKKKKKKSIEDQRKGGLGRKKNRNRLMTTKC